MRTRTFIAAGALAALVLGADAASAAQGQGQGKGRGNAAPAQEKGQGQQQAERQQGRGQGSAKAQAPGSQAKGKGRSDDAPSRTGAQSARPTDPPGRARAAAARSGNPAAANAAGRGNSARRYERAVTVNDVPQSARQFFASNRRPQVVAAGALARAHIRGVDDDLRIVPVNNGVRLLNQRGDMLLELDERRARDLGAWHVNPFDMPADAGAPSFCRSGAGHPVWGRQWCVDKGFGLGTFQDVRWGRTSSLGDIIFGRRNDAGNLATNALLGLVGNTVFDRLALHAVTLGYTEPLVGTWVTENTGPQVLLVSAGPAPVAELVDTNRDGRADLMFVALRPW